MIVCDICKEQIAHADRADTALAPSFPGCSVKDLCRICRDAGNIIKGDADDDIRNYKSDRYQQAIEQWRNHRKPK